MSQMQCKCGRGPMNGHGEPCDKCIEESLNKTKEESSK